MIRKLSSSRKTFWLLVASLVCFLANFFSHHQLVVAILNSIIFLMSLEIFQTIGNNEHIKAAFRKAEYGPILACAGLIPLFHFNPKNAYVLIIFVLALIFLLLYRGAGKLGIIPLLISLFLLLLGNLIVGGIVYLPSKPLSVVKNSISINKEQTIFFNEAIPRLIKYHQDEIPLPHKLNFLLYNNFVYLPYWLGNLGHFVSLKNFFDVLLLANVYPLFWGIRLYFKNLQCQERLFVAWMAITLVVIAINKSADKFNSLYLASPWLLYMILLGMHRTKMKIYLPFLVLSFLLLLAPKL
ncbi:hypothetical protein FJZ40_01725 [Candidatus Shapirobacteria bacterium]|nr:hypothetical protein [Candidatus Shapirobacteria bacterium]